MGVMALFMCGRYTHIRALALYSSTPRWLLWMTFKTNCCLSLIQLIEYTKLFQITCYTQTICDYLRYLWHNIDVRRSALLNEIS